MTRLDAIGLQQLDVFELVHKASTEKVLFHYMDGTIAEGQMMRSRQLRLFRFMDLLEDARKKEKKKQ